MWPSVLQVVIWHMRPYYRRANVIARSLDRSKKRAAVYHDRFVFEFSNRLISHLHLGRWIFPGGKSSTTSRPLGAPKKGQPNSIHLTV